MEFCLSGLRSATRPSILHLPRQLCAQVCQKTAYRSSSYQKLLHAGFQPSRSITSPKLSRTVKAMSAASATHRFHCNHRTQHQIVCFIKMIAFLAFYWFNQFHILLPCYTGTQVDSPSAQIIDGKAIADSIRKEIATEVKALQEKYGKVRGPAVSSGD